MFERALSTLKGPIRYTALLIISKSSDKPEVSISIPQDFISVVIPAIYKCFSVLFGIVDVFNTTDGISLSVAFSNRETGTFLPDTDYFGIQESNRTTAMA
jgi:hypothetical protein